MTMKSQEFFISGNFIVPTAVTCIHITMIGGGGGSGSGVGGSGSFPNGSGAGGSGEIVQRFSVNVTPGQSIPITIGVGGAAGAAVEQNGGQGGSSQVGTFLRCLGGVGGINWHGGAFGGKGGGINGAVYSTSDGVLGNKDSPTHFGGGSGGRGGVTRDGYKGCGDPGFSPPAGGVWGGPSFRGGGGGGASSPWGQGPTGADSSVAASSPAATAYGAGAGGAGAFKKGATGASGYCLIQWMG